MSSLWLCLLFTYLFITTRGKAIEKTDDGEGFEEKLRANLADLSSFTPINRTLNSFVSENATNNSEDNLQELFRAIKSPESSAIKEIANATKNAFLKIHPFNATHDFLKKFILPMLSNLSLKRKRQAESSNDHSVDKNLPINRLLDATDKLFHQTAFIDKMLDKEESNSEKQYKHLYIDNRELVQDHAFTPIRKENEPIEVDARYSALLEKIFTNPVQSVIQEKAQPKQKLTAKRAEANINPRPDGPLASAALLLIRKIRNVILNVVQKIQDDKKVGAKVFALSAITAFSLSVGVSATKAFYMGYEICETICRFLTGQSGLVTCNLFDILARPINGIRNSVSKISNLIGFGKKLLNFSTNFVNF